MAVTNVGDGTLGGLAVVVGSYAGGATGWLDAALGSVTAPSTLSLTADAEGLEPGVYSAAVSVSSAQAGNSPQSVAVSLTVTAAPPDTFTVVVSASPAAGGRVSGAGSFVDGSSVTVVAQANSGYTFTRWAEEGTGVSTSASYIFTIAGDRTLVAEFAGNQGPAIGLSADSVGFVTEEGEEPDPEELEVEVINVGQGTLTGLRVSVGGWTGGETGWLDMDLGRGRAPTTLTLETDDADDLDPGVYTAVVTVSSSQSEITPRTLRVTLTVTPESSDLTLNLPASGDEGLARSPRPSPSPGWR